MKLFSSLSSYTLSLLFITSNILPTFSHSIDKQVALGSTNNENSVISHLRNNQIQNDFDEDRRLSWWLLFWNALHPHLPCPPKCHDHGKCPPHCSGSSSGDSSVSSSGGDGDSGSNSSSYYSAGDDAVSSSSYGDDDGDDGDDASGGGGGGGSYYTGGSDGSNSAESATKEATVSSLNSNRGYLALLCAGVAAAGAIVAVALGQRRGEAQKPHPLQGSLGRRMMLFSGLANKNILSANRPERVVEIAENSNDSNVDYVRC